MQRNVIRFGLAGLSLACVLSARPIVRADEPPVTDTAKQAGQAMGASMVALGALAGATGLVGLSSLAEAVGEVLPPHRRKLADANQHCLALGAEYVASQGGAASPQAWA